MDSQQQQHQQPQQHQLQQEQQPHEAAPAQPQQAYHPAASNQYIQPVQQANNEQPLPPSYDQAKNTAAGQPPQGPNTQSAPPMVVIPLNQLGDQPQWIDCPFCHHRATTTVTREGTSMQM
jgi:hypothetical protein